MNGEEPRRKLQAGPLAGLKADNFTVTNTFVRNKDPNDIQGQLKNIQATEDLEITGQVKVLSSITTTKESFCVKYTEEHDFLASGYTDGKVRLFSSANAKCTSTLVDDEINDNPSPVTCIKHRPVNKNYPIANCITATYANGFVKCWNYNFGQCIYTIREKRQTYGITYHPRLPKFITAGDNGKLYYYDEESKVQERILSGSDNASMLDGHTSRVFAACFNPQSNHELITGGWDNVVLFWDLRQPFALRHLSGLHIGGEGLDIDSTGKQILTCSWQAENPLQIWDYPSGNLITTIEPDIVTSKLYCGKFIGKEYLICGGSNSNILRLIDRQTAYTIASIKNLPKGVYSIDIGPPKTKEKSKDVSKAMELASLPRIAFSAGTKIFQVDFSSK